MRKIRFIAAALLCVIVLGVLFTPWRDMTSTAKDFLAWQIQAGKPDQADVMIPMADGVRLATDVYLPSDKGARPTVLMRLPYGKRSYGEVRFWVDKLTKRGFVVIAQDMRGRYGSEGVFAPYPYAGTDGVATLDWITAQPWSNGRVGTLGCSALGEAQLMLAAEAHPAHQAMVPIAAGGAIGSLDGSHAYFSVYEGGIFALATGAGWFGTHGGKAPAHSAGIATTPASVLPHLPVRDVVRQMRSDPTDYEAFLHAFEDPAYWQNAGYVTGEEPFATPALFIDTWYDPGIRSTLQLARAVAKQDVETRTIIAAGTHCGYLGSEHETLVGDLAVAPEQPFGFVETIIAFLSQHLEGGPALELPEFSYYGLVENKWRSAQVWPPKAAREVSFYLGEGQALTPTVPVVETQAWQFQSDPMNPVPSVGGALCCTGDPEALVGPVFQNAIEGREDVLMFTSAPLEEPMLLAGPIRATLLVSADVLDTDLVLRLTDVDPEGNSLLLQEGALRMRYRDGVERPALMEPGQTYSATIQMRDIAYLLRAGHRLRLNIAGSSFPRLERNLNTGGANWDETEGLVANITIHSDAAQPSAVTVYVLDE